MTQRSPRAGFTVIEAVMVLLIIMTIIGALTPSVIRQITHARVNRAARVIAADFMFAQSTAARARKPVSVTVDTTLKTVTFVETQTATTVATRRFGTDTEFKLRRLVASPQTVLVFPNAVFSTAITVTISDGSYNRTITASRAGQVRVQ